MSNETQTQVKAEAPTPEELALLAKLQTKLATYQTTNQSGLINQAVKHILSMPDRFNRINQAKNKNSKSPKHNICLNVQTKKVVIPTPSGTFNVDVTIWITSKNSTPLSHKEQAKEIFDYLGGKESGLNFSDIWQEIQDRFKQAQEQA